MWLCVAGVRWKAEGPVWSWWHPSRGRRESPVRLGGRISIAVADGETRRCVGVWSAAHHAPCPAASAVAPRSRSDQCERCAALDRSRSVAADTRADDARPFHVYLAYFGPGLRKVGITAAERGAARLLEQAALCFTFLGRGPLMGARRAESVLGAALGLPDRVSTAAKRAARAELPPAGARTAELGALYEAAAAAPDWRDTVTALPFAPVDHVPLFGPTPAPAAVVTELAPGTALSGTLAAAAGSDLYVETPDGILLLDAHLASGWHLTPAPPGLPQPPLRPWTPATEPAEPLF